MIRTLSAALIAAVATAFFALPASAGGASFQDRWTGPYIGVHATYASATDETTPGQQFNSVQASGFLGGISIGHNYRFGSLVMGYVLDYSAGNLSGSQSDMTCTIYTCGIDIKRTQTSTINSMATARLKAGIPMGNFMPYVTGGWAVASAKTSVRYDYGCFGCTSDTTTTKQMLGAPIWGGGVMWAFSQDKRWTASLEYLQADFTSEVATNYSLTRDNVAVKQLRIGLNYNW